MNKKKFFKEIIDAFKKIFHTIGIVQTFILLTITYFVVVGLVSILSKIARRDFLNIRLKKSQTFWEKPENISDNLEEFLHQF